MALPPTGYTHRGDFLAEMKNNILLAIFEEASDTRTPHKKTSNSVIQEYKSTVSWDGVFIDFDLHIQLIIY